MATPEVAAMAAMDITAVGSLPGTAFATANNTMDLFELPQFDPEIHLNFQLPTACHSFTELGLPKPVNAPDVCYTEPFQLFSEEGVRMMRRELFQKEFLDKYMRTWDRAPCYIGGHSNHPKVRLPPKFFDQSEMMLTLSPGSNLHQTSMVSPGYTSRN